MPIELDYMEYADDAAAQAAYKSSSEPVSWDMSDDCSSVVGWAMSGIGVSGQAPVQVTFDGKSCFKFENGGGGNDESYGKKDFGDIATDFTLDIDLYFDLLGLDADLDSFRVVVRTEDTTLLVTIATDKVAVYDGAAYIEVGTPTITLDAWQTWRFVVDGTAETVDIYRYDHDSGIWDTICIGADCSVGATTPYGEVWLTLYGFTLSTIAYVDEIRIEDAKHPPDLACFSEDAIKEQGSYSLKGIAKQTGSLNDTLTRTVAIDLTSQTQITFDARGSRTGSQFKVGIHDSGGTTTEHTVNIAQANTWQSETWDISGVADADKDTIDQIIITVVNADADNTFYIDNMFSLQIAELQGSLAGESGVTGALDLIEIQLLAGALGATSGVAGAIDSVLIFGLAGLIAGQSSSAGNINIIKMLDGQIAAQSALTAKLRDLSSLSGSLASQSTVGGNLTLLELLAGAIAGQSKVLVGNIQLVYVEITPAMHEDLIDPYGDMGAWLWLAEIVVPTQTTQRIARDTADVVYGDVTFIKNNFGVGHIPLAGDGSIPRIQLRVAQDGTGILEDIVNATKGGENGTVKLIRTCEKYFDKPIKALERTYDILTAGSDSQWVTFTLGLPNLLIQRVPLWSYSSKVCPYATPSLFKGVRCQLPSEHEDTVCTGLYEDCYAKGNAAHWGAELGLDPNAVRI